MKKLFFILGCVCLVSCAVTHDAAIGGTATYQNPNNRIFTATVAELKVSPTRITFTYNPSDEVRNGGDENVIQTAVREALRTNGDADVLVGLEYIKLCEKQSSIFKSTITQITVTGYPATYSNFHPMEESIWSKQPDILLINTK